jgi:hypothetical protein
MKKISIFVMNNKKMKNLFTLIIVIFILLSCSSKKSVQLSDGSRITEKKYESIIDNSFKQGLSEVTENDVKLLENTNVDVEFIIIDSIFLYTIYIYIVHIYYIHIHSIYNNTIYDNKNRWHMDCCFGTRSVSVV